VRAVDTATHPDWQGRGVFSALTARLVAEVVQENTVVQEGTVGEEGTAFVFNTPNRKSGGGYRTMGWRVVGRLPVLVRPLGLPGTRHRGGGPGALPPAGAFLARPEAEPFLAAVERRRRRDRRLRTAATAAYLRWRYADAPDLDYRAAWAGSGEAAAALVLRLRRRRGLREAAVTEVLVAGDAGVATAAGLLRSLRASSRADHAVAVASPGSDEHAALRRAGFLPLPGVGPRLFVRPLDPASGMPDAEPSSPDHLSSWRFAAGSFELF
jgi:GNAT superfamily N-acetyltransferase